MSLNKNTVWQLLLIAIAAAIVIAIGFALGGTEWADGLRADAHFHDEVEGNVFVIWLGQLVKQTFLMGIPALITLGVLRLFRRKKK